MTVRKPIILAIDDEADMLETYRSVLKKNYQVLTAASGEAALKICHSQPVSLVLLDIRLPQMDGITVLKKLRDDEPNLNIIMVTASKDVSSAVDTIKLGAFDYVCKPFDVKELLALIEKALEKQALIQENLYLKESLAASSAYHDFIGRSGPMKKLFGIIERVAPTDSTVLIHGESGTGKELVARALHQQSPRANKPFIAVNCAAIPENLFESDLFGHERGAFTGAFDRKIGKFELANGGTLFLDEIGCMPAPMQAKLLRVLEDQVIERVGGEKGIPIDVRLLSATNINFEKHIQEGKFRADLYYRLNVIPILLPPLRERNEDIPLLIDHFIKRFNKTLNKKVKGLTQPALEQLLAYAWPGNVRELQNMVERLVVLATGPMITPEELPLIPKRSSHDKVAGSLKANVESFEKDIINIALDDHQGNISQAAKDLKLPRTSLITRMKALGMEYSEK